MPQEATVWVDDQHASKATALTELNHQSLRAAHDSITFEQEWEFYCECGDADCDEDVALTIPAYCTLRENGGAVLAPGHALSSVRR